MNYVQTIRILASTFWQYPLLRITDEGFVSSYSGSTTTAVPVAEMTITLSRSEDSRSRPMTALAPISCARCFIRSMASTLAFSISVVNAETSPPTMDCKPATNFPPTPRVRAVRPETTPTIFFTRYPGIVGVVTIGKEVVAGNGDIAAPHRVQNFVSSGSSAPHLVQYSNSITQHRYVS